MFLQARKRAAAREQSGVGGGGLAMLGDRGASDSDYSASSDGEADVAAGSGPSRQHADSHTVQRELAHAGMKPSAPTVADREALALSLLAG